MRSTSPFQLAAGEGDSAGVFHALRARLFAALAPQLEVHSRNFDLAIVSQVLLPIEIYLREDSWFKSQVMIYNIRIGHKQSWGFEPRVLRRIHRLAGCGRWPLTQSDPNLSLLIGAVEYHPGAHCCRGFFRRQTNGWFNGRHWRSLAAISEFKR